MKEKQNKQIKIENHIPIGKENAMYQSEIATMLDIKPSMVKALVRQARQEGIVISSGSNGYWIADSGEDERAFLNRSKKNAFTRLKTVKAMEEASKIPKGQRTLKEEVESNDKEC